MSCTFDESFRDLSIASRSGARWSAHTPWNGDFGDAAFSDPGPDGPFSLGPRGLRITASQGPDGRWRSGLICSIDKDGDERRGFAQQFGYFEMCARFPEGMGVWPAFWLIGVNKSLFSAELDVVEFYGGFNEYYHSVAHIFEDGNDKLNLDRLIKVKKSSLSGRFNTFGAYLEPELVRIFHNRREVARWPGGSEFHQPMYMLANLALGGGWPISGLTSPQVMEIAWMRAFTRPDLQAMTERYR